MLKTFAAILLSFFVDASAIAQHCTKLPTANNIGFIRIPYFIDSLHGFLYQPGLISGWGGPGVGNLPSLLESTSDGGSHWVSINYFDSLNLQLNQLYFVSPLHGYAATTGGSLDAGVYETFDLGKHWTRILTSDHGATSIYAANGTVFANMFGYGPSQVFGPMLFSRDDGVTWDSLNNVTGILLGPSPQFQYVFGNRDSLVATVYFKQNPGNNSKTTDLIYSTDLGNTWNAQPIDSLYQGFLATLHISPHTCEIQREYDPGPFAWGVDKYTFYISNPDFSEWDSVLDRETGAWIAGNACALYLSDAADGTQEDKDTSVSLFRSTNNGATWQELPREVGKTPAFVEIDDFDYPNISVVGHGAIVYADSSGLEKSYTTVSSLWKTTDGGDGTLNPAMLAPRFALGHISFGSSQDTITISQCASSLIEVYDQNIGCSYGKFDSITITGLESSEFSIVSSHHCSCKPMPDTSFITLQPQETGIRNVTVHYHFTDDEFDTIDTSIQFTLNFQPGGTSVPLTLSFQSSSMNASPGDTISVPIYLSGDASIGATSITLPFGVDTNILVPVGFQPAINGLTVGSMSYSGGTETVPLQTNGLTLDGETLLGYLRCIVYLTDTLSTSITLPTATLNSPTTPCTALSLATDSIAINIGGCGTKTLQQFMLTDSIPFSISSIVPNPAQDAIAVQLAAVGGHAIEYELFDALGKSSVSGSCAADVRSTSLRLDVSSLPAGTYYLRMSEGGYVQTRRVAIER